MSYLRLGSVLLLVYAPVLVFAAFTRTYWVKVNYDDPGTPAANNLGLKKDAERCHLCTASALGLGKKPLGGVNYQ